jgi:hypothetical protein
MAIVSRKISGIWVLEFLCRKLTEGHLEEVEGGGGGMRRQLATVECAENGMERNGGMDKGENIPWRQPQTNSFSE